MIRLGIAAACVLLVGCVEETAVDGRLLFMDSCAGCHGVSGMGDGEFGQQLIKPPADLTTLAARYDGVFPRDYVMSTIDGYRRGSHFSASMPVFGDGDLGPTVIIEDGQGNGTPVPVKLLALANYLETIQR
jgi:hypothetical protein